MKRVKSGAEGLPAKFTKEERDCYQWLYDCGIKGLITTTRTITTTKIVVLPDPIRNTL